MKGYLGLFFSYLFFFLCSQTQAANFYIDANGSSSGAGTIADPLGFLPSYLNSGSVPGVGPGDTVFVMPGTYGLTTDYWNGCRIDISGTPGNPIVVKGLKDAAGNRPKIISASVSGLVVANAQYLVIEGFEVEPAETNPNNLTSDWFRARIGINISANSSMGNIVNNITVRDCFVHDMPGTGIGSGGANYIRIENNLVEHCGYGSNSGNSGISFYRPGNLSGTAFSDHPAYQIIVKGNISRYNTNLVGCTCFSNQLTDGNGIIFDSFEDLSYTGRSLIANNVCYGNGGKGISVFKSSNTDVAFNTCYDNAVTPDVPQAYTIAISDSEIQIQQTDNVRVLNNVLFNTGGGAGITGNFNDNFVAKGNLINNADGSIASVPVGNVMGNPDFINATPMSYTQKTTLSSSSNPFNANSVSASLRFPTANGFPIQDLHIGQNTDAAGIADTTLFQIATDINGTSRYGKMDAGAFVKAMAVFQPSIQEEAVGTLALFPNPVSDATGRILNLKSELLNEATSIRIVHATGSVVKQRDLPAQAEPFVQISLLDLAPGLYWLELKSASSSVGCSVLVQ